MIRIRQFTPGNLARRISNDGLGIMMDIEPGTPHACWDDKGEWQVFEGLRCYVPMEYRADTFETTMKPEGFELYVTEVFICGGMTGIFLSPI